MLRATAFALAIALGPYTPTAAQSPPVRIDDAILNLNPADQSQEIGVSEDGRIDADIPTQEVIRFGSFHRLNARL